MKHLIWFAFDIFGATFGFRSYFTNCSFKCQQTSRPGLILKKSPVVFRVWDISPDLEIRCSYFIICDIWALHLFLNSRLMSLDLERERHVRSLFEPRNEHKLNKPFCSGLQLETFTQTNIIRRCWGSSHLLILLLLTSIEWIHQSVRAIMGNTSAVSLWDGLRV